MLDKLVESLTTPSPSCPRGFLAFVRREVTRLFPKSWDSGYDAWCRVTSPPLSSVFDVKIDRSSGSCDQVSGAGGQRSRGGCLGAMEVHGFDQASYLDAVFGRAPLPKTLEGQLLVVQSSGKPRPLSKFDKEGLFLKPLHKTIYSHLSKKKWLCRGDVTAEKLAKAGFSFSSGTVLTSGDYKSATDGLFREISRAILESLMTNCTSVPLSVREYALASLDPMLYRNLGTPRDPEWVAVDTVRGQMMGSYLSFPLLCLVNFLAYRWVCKDLNEFGPVLINGDDILFQSSPAFSKAWMDFVPTVGLEVEKVKTGVDSDWGSLNSTCFRWDEGGRLALVRTLRFGMLRQQTVPNGLGYSFRDFVAGLEGELRWRAGKVFFEYHVGTMREFAYSLPSLGFRGTLAARLARVFGLFFERIDVSVPIKKHHVELPADLISLVPRGFLSSEESSFSSDETAAWKWGVGWKGVEDDVSEAVQWALRTSQPRPRSWAVPYAPLFWCSDAEFTFRLRNAREEKRESRKEREAAFAAPLPVREFDRIMTSVFDLLLVDCRGELPPYEEMERSDVVAGPPAYLK